MSCSSDSEENTGEKNKSDLIFVASFVRDNPIILKKGKTPIINKKKEQALVTLKTVYENNFGKVTDSKKLLKQINNLKAVVKKKTDANATGNKKKKLSRAEQLMYEALQGDQDEGNPVLNKVPVLGHVAAGICAQGSTCEELAGSVRSEPPLPAPPPPPRPPRPKQHKFLEKYETEETRGLSNTELQRLVLLKQLHVLNMKKEKLEKELGYHHDVIQEEENNYYTVL